MALWLLLASAVAGLSGCASPAALSNGLKWALEQEQERRNLHAQGFEQYSRE